VFKKVEIFPGVEAFIMALFTVDCPECNPFEPISLMNALGCNNLFKKLF